MPTRAYENPGAGLGARQIIRQRPSPAALPPQIRSGILGPDATAPITTYVIAQRTRLSYVTGFEVTDIEWAVNEDARAWEFRVVASEGATHNDGTLIVAGSATTGHAAAPAHVSQHTTISAAALPAGDGDKLVKIFAQDLGGNWSS